MARYLQAISTAFDTIAEATGALASPAPARVRLSVHPAFAACWLIQRLGRFRDAHPDCAVVLDATPRVVALERDEADIAIRNGDVSRPGLTRDLLARSRLYPVGARSLLTTHGTARRSTVAPDELARLVLLHDEDDGGLWRRWFAAAGIADAKVSRGLHILESGLAIDAAIAGQGIALADEFLVADDLAQGRLVKMCDIALSADDCDYYVVSLETVRRQRSVAALRAWLLQESAALRPSE